MISLQNYLEIVLHLNRNELQLCIYVELRGQKSANILQFLNSPIYLKHREFTERS